jgi:hypothetical protein
VVEQQESKVILHEFLTVYRDAIIDRTRARLLARPWPSASDAELEHGVPLFLTQLAETLKREGTASPFSSNAIGTTATRHGGELQALGFSISQVVHDYGDICQAVTELALEQRAPITAAEFHTLNRCLDTAIAEAVTEHERVSVERASLDELERSGEVAHEIRNLVGTASMAFQMLKRGSVAVNGSTGAVLGRSLMDLSAFVESMLSDIRLNTKAQPRERITVASFVADIAANARLHADYGGLDFAVERSSGLDSDRRPSAPRLSGDEPSAQRVQIHTAGGARHPPCPHQRHTSPDRGRGRVRWSSNRSRRPISTVWSAARIRSQRARSGAVHCSEGGLGPRRRDRHTQHAGTRLRLHHRRAAGIRRDTDPD